MSHEFENVPNSCDEGQGGTFSASLVINDQLSGRLIVVN